MSFLIADQPVVLYPGEGKHLDVLGNAMTLLASHKETKGAFSVVTLNTPPGAGSPLHTHHGEDEAMYVLDGEYEIRYGDKTVRARAGTFVFAPRNIAHKFSNVSTGQSRMLILLAPAGFERFFEEVNELGQPPDMEKILVLAKKYELEIHAP